jgi:hypothetical protein
MFGMSKSVPPWTLSLPRLTMPPKKTITNPRQDEDPQPVDSDQSGAQEAGPSRPNRDRCGIFPVQVIDEGYLETVQHVMAKNVTLEQQNHKLMSENYHNPCSEVIS